MDTHTIKLIIDSLAQDRRAYFFFGHQMILNAGQRTTIKMAIVMVTHDFYNLKTKFLYKL